MQTIDFLVVGAGTAGCVLAARLSDDPARRVVLLESGPDFPGEAALPPSLRDGDGSGFDWGLTAKITGDRVDGLARGRVVGGCSQVNGKGAIRALPRDFAAWAASGAPSWSWERVLASYRAIESDQQFGDAPWHGSDGPVPITRWPREEWSPVMNAFLEATLALGHSYQPDINAPGAVGIGPYPSNRRDAVRMSTALTHLAPVRSRPNLTVRADLTVDSIVIERGRATGVRAGNEVIRAREVILAAGCPGTPLLLLRSGIGPRPERGTSSPNYGGTANRPIDYKPGVGSSHNVHETPEAGSNPNIQERSSVGSSGQVHELPGVGRGLYDQPGAVVPMLPVPGAFPDDAPTTQVFGRLAGFPGHTPDDAFYLTLFVGPPPGGGPPMSALMIGDLAPASRGEITLDGIDLAFYSAPGDLARMRSAYRHAADIAHQPEFADTVRQFLIPDEVVDDDDALDEVLRGMTFSRLALLGGAAMGPASDPMAVVGDDCRVHGIEGLRIADLSIVPVPLRAPTALDAMMIGHHAATMIAT